MAYRYLTVKINGKTKLKHRHIMEQYLGRTLARNEQVHHRNEDIRDNRIENLQVLTVQAHMAQHKTKHPKESTCTVCGETFTPAPTKRARAKTCSTHCANTARSRTEKATKSSPPMAKALILANFKHEQQIARAA
jgi:protein-arginine kinase activator protein McsA